jgi:hypothetical protein
MLRFAVVTLASAVAIYLALHLIATVLPQLVVVAVLVGVAYAVVAVMRYRRSRW